MFFVLETTVESSLEGFIRKHGLDLQQKRCSLTKTHTFCHFSSLKSFTTTIFHFNCFFFLGGGPKIMHNTYLPVKPASINPPSGRSTTCENLQTGPQGLLVDCHPKLLHLLFFFCVCVCVSPWFSRVFQKETWGDVEDWGWGIDLGFYLICLYQGFLMIHDAT